MSEYMPKFYTLEDMTQEDLNKLALERNTFASEIESLKKENKRLYKDLDKYDGALINCTYEKICLLVTIDKAIQKLKDIEIDNIDFKQFKENQLKLLEGSVKE